MASSSSSKWNCLKFPFAILLIGLLFLITNYIFFTVNYDTRHLQDEWFEKPDEKTGPEWYEAIAREFKDESFNVGLVNVGPPVRSPKANLLRVDFDRVDESVRWAHLAPERIDENSTCPGMPMPRFEDYRDLDVVVAGVEHCNDVVFRLQVNLVVANLLVRSGRKEKKRPVYAVFVGKCEPMWEIFRCDDLLSNKGDSRVYKPELARIEELVDMPVGPCQFVPPFSHFGDQDLWKNTNHITKQINNHNKKHDVNRRSKEAYVTVLHTSEDYVCGAIVLAQSIIQSNSTKDLILLADDKISPQSINALRAAGWQTKLIQRIRSPYSKQNTYNEWNYSKLRIWQLTQYEKIIFIDSDLIVNTNLDKFFTYPQLTAAGNYQKHFFNSGLMIVEPSECAFETLVKKMTVVESYNGGDQGFLNEMFAWWHRLPAQTNYLKVFVDDKDRLHYVDRKYVFAVHYTGLKPWKCEDEESDCNWDVLEFHRYASNSAHKIWWKVYKSMPEDLRAYCMPYRGKNGALSPRGL
ncbi:plant glycogenin-like starch initiation protein [Striga asiatica]|uniref:Hexosyltransferase n=1 Tax=Striga asiatica TaxID=4170 RepID=A0A5A7NZX0_STRAF|nr:plant glycogenin-like starch initiation protein [Striga asiatica]